MSAVIGWWLMAVGFASGAGMGLLAQDEQWLGGYTSQRGGWFGSGISHWWPSGRSTSSGR